jgi:hypothetical protein
MISMNPPHLRQGNTITGLWTEQELQARKRIEENGLVTGDQMTKDNCVARILTILSHMRTNITSNADLFYQQLREVDSLVTRYLA